VACIEGWWRWRGLVVLRRGEEGGTMGVVE
jgi:hypothetical protein